jgi:hypothetical protein
MLGIAPSKMQPMFSDRLIVSNRSGTDQDEQDD